MYQKLPAALWIRKSRHDVRARTGRSRTIIFKQLTLLTNLKAQYNVSSTFPDCVHVSILEADSTDCLLSYVFITSRCHHLVFTYPGEVLSTTTSNISPTSATTGTEIPVMKRRITQCLAPVVGGDGS